MNKFYHLLPPQHSSPAQFQVCWVRVKDMSKWFLSSDGDIDFYIGNFGRGKHNEQFWFDYEYEAWGAIARYYQKHDEPFPYMKNITEQFIPPGLHNELLAVYGEDNIWWVKQ